MRRVLVVETEEEYQDTIDLLEEDTLHLRVGLLTDEDLSGEGAEGALGVIRDDAGRGLAELAMRQPDGGWNELGDTLAFGLDPGTALARTATSLSSLTHQLRVGALLRLVGTGWRHCFRAGGTGL